MKYQYIIFSLFCLSLFLGCDEEEITPRGLGLPSRFEFPEGDNAWDEELVSIYDTYHTMLIYKNLDSSDFVRSWVETGGIGTSGYSGQALDDELAAFYTDFVKNQVFAFLKPELVEGVLPNYIYLTYDLRQKGTATSGDYSLANYWNGMDFWAWCLKMDPEGLSQWTTCFDLPATPWEHKLRRGVILQNIISEMVEKGRITIPIEFEEDFDYSTPIKYSNADLLDMYNSLYGHGAVFESELAAFRIYMDNRQSIDIYGKTHPRLEMDHTGFYTTKEQLAQGYGCDILWAGQSVGAGSFRGYQNEKPCYIDTVAWRRQTVLASGPVRAIVEVADGQWTYNGHPLQMRQRYTLYAGHRDVEVSVDISGSLPGDTFCTGIQKLESEPSGFMQEDGLCGSWGCNVPEKSEPGHREWVGLGLYAAPGNRIGMKEDDFNYLTLLQPDKDRQIRYRLTVCARREKGGFKTAQEWFDYLRQWKAEADSPCTVTVR